ncbi:MAG: DUF3267 domain-containing protein [Lachnospiraceae bacterium]|nr:DUF3267 domain-containing protein [Lachnospiraceae bacterium]
MKNKRRIDKLHTIIYAILIMVLVFVFIKTDLLDIIGSNTDIHLGKFEFSVKLKIILFIIAFYVNAFLHEGIHVLTGKIFLPDAKYSITIMGPKAHATRHGGDPTRIQDQIITIMPFLILSVMMFSLGLAVKDFTDLPMYFVIFNTAGSISDIESFLFMFCFPQNRKLSEIRKMDTMEKSTPYHRFWKRWREFFYA